jgi:hypothetical protein
VLPSLGNLAANIAHENQFGFARASTETPQPITNILTTRLVIDGKCLHPPARAGRSCCAAGVPPAAPHTDLRKSGHRPAVCLPTPSMSKGSRS